MEYERNRSKRRQVIVIHVLVWGVLAAIPFIVNPFMSHRPRELMVVPYIHLLSLLFVYYVNANVLVPKLLLAKKMLLYLLAIVALVGVVFWGTQRVLQFVHMELGAPARLESLNTIGALGKILFRIILLFMVVALGIAIKLFERLAWQEQHHVNIQKEQLNTELAFLKNQINPHFFFNTLNTIYSLTNSNPAAAQDTLLKLSSLMRYLLYETEKPFTTLAKEVEFLKGYIELMKVRIPSNVSVTFVVDVSHPNRQLPPLLFIPFVENAFKHGVSNAYESRIEIVLIELNDALVFKSRNPVFRKQLNLGGGGIGLENVKRRLKLLYTPDQYCLVVEEKEQRFSINLSIPLNDD